MAVYKFGWFLPGHPQNGDDRVWYSLRSRRKRGRGARMWEKNPSSQNPIFLPRSPFSPHSPITLATQARSGNTFFFCVHPFFVAYLPNLVPRAFSSFKMAVGETPGQGCQSGSKNSLEFRPANTMKCLCFD